MLPPVYSTTVWPGRSRPSRSARLDHGQRHPVLVGAGGVRRLELDPDLGAVLVDQLVRRRRACRRSRRWHSSLRSLETAARRMPRRAGPGDTPDEFPALRTVSSLRWRPPGGKRSPSPFSGPIARADLPGLCDRVCALAGAERRRGCLLRRERDRPGRGDGRCTGPGSSSRHGGRGCRSGCATRRTELLDVLTVHGVARRPTGLTKAPARLVPATTRAGRGDRRAGRRPRCRGRT